MRTHYKKHAKPLLIQTQKKLVAFLQIWAVFVFSEGNSWRIVGNRSEKGANLIGVHACFWFGDRVFIRGVHRLPKRAVCLRDCDFLGYVPVFEVESGLPRVWVDAWNMLKP
jgi:hypothetical protein